MYVLTCDSCGNIETAADADVGLHFTGGEFIVEFCCVECGEWITVGALTLNDPANWQGEGDNPSVPAPRVGTRVEEGEAGAVWLGENAAGEGAALYMDSFLLTMSVLPAWMTDGELSIDDRSGAHAPDLDAPQLARLAAALADLHQCAGCGCWFREDEICPECGEGVG
jgi:hypothetical protein